MNRIERIGKPGGDNYPYLCETAGGRQIVVYAESMNTAVIRYRVYKTVDPWKIKQMGDNE